MGGLIFWIYFFQIQYFPDLDFDESVLLLLLAAITGIFFLLLMAYIFMIPYFFRWLMLFAYELELAGKDEQKENREKTVGELIWYFSSIFLVFLAYFLNYFKDYKCDFEEPIWIFEKHECVFWTLIVVICLGHIKCYLRDSIIGLWGTIKKFDLKKIWDLLKQTVKRINPFKKTDKKAKNEKKEETKWQRNIYVLISWFFSAITSVFPLLIFISIIDPIWQIESKELLDQIILLVVFYFIVMSVNFTYAYYREQSEKKWWFWSIPFVPVIALFYIAGDPLIPKMVMKRFHLGNFKAEQFTVNEGGCKILKDLGIKPNLNEGEKIEPSQKCNFKEITILSRLGNNFRLEKEIDDKIINFNIRKKNVLSWSIFIPKDKEENNPETDKDIGSAQTTNDTIKEAETCPKARRAEK
jgi:hypothetical protein